MSVTQEDNLIPFRFKVTVTVMDKLNPTAPTSETGLNTIDEVLSFIRLVYSTSSVFYQYNNRSLFMEDNEIIMVLDIAPILIDKIGETYYIQKRNVEEKESYEQSL
jgi:hypothetical protein